MEDSISDIRNMEGVLVVVILAFIIITVWLKRKGRKK